MKKRSKKQRKKSKKWWRAKDMVEGQRERDSFKMIDGLGYVLQYA